MHGGTESGEDEKQVRGSMAPLAIRLFGPPEILVQGERLPALRSRKGLWLLALLTLRGERAVERAWLAGTLWPDSPEGLSLYNLRRSLLDLRRALGPEACRLGSPTPHHLALSLTGAAVDLLGFDQAIARGDAASLAEAISLYRGPLLEGCEESWAFQERQAREEAYLQARERLAALALQAGEVADAERHLRLAVAVDPLREGTQRTLMQVLAAGGNYAAALFCYRELRLRLHRELNTEPDPETKTLFQQLRSEARAKAGDRRQTTDDSKVEGPTPRPPLFLPELSLADCRLPTGTVTFLFTDIEGSTRLWEQHPKAMRDALARHNQLLLAAIEAHGGHLFKTMGDQCCAAFATGPEALSAALAAQRALHAEPWGDTGPLRVRMALHTGATERQQGDYLGPPLKRVARLLATAHGGQILLSLATAQLVSEGLPDGSSLRDLGLHRLPDLSHPEQIFQLLAADLPADFPPLRSLAVAPNSLPQPLTRFIGREDQIAEVQQWLREHRLVTLTGAGGCGKTRLALAVATELLATFPDGVAFVDLAALADPQLVPQAVATALGLKEAPGRPPAETLRDFLQPRHLLLGLDNCEHLLAACAHLAHTMLQSCPRLRVLATSREALGITGERTYRVPPLSLPGPQERPALEQVTQYEAVRLFSDRAAAVHPSFQVTPENAEAVTRICRRLEGMPLAIELAAARVKALPVPEIASRLDDMFRLLTGGSRTALPRQQTLRATIDWSYDLLSTPERPLLRRLSVFAGGCTLEAAGALCSGDSIEEWEVLDLLTSLVEKSLVVYEAQGGEGRYRLLETVRQYARDRLLEMGETEAVRDRHLAFFLQLAERAEPELHRHEQIEWLNRLEVEHDNVRAALAWTRAQAKGEEGLRLGGAVFWFWVARGYLGEGREQLARLLAPGAPYRDGVSSAYF